jgi:hypothetical protein
VHIYDDVAELVRLAGTEHAAGREQDDASEADDEG